MLNLKARGAGRDITKVIPVGRNSKTTSAPVALLIVSTFAQHYVIRSHRGRRDITSIIDSKPVLGAGVPVPAAKAPKKPAKRLVDRRVPRDGVVRMGHAVLAPVLRGNELDKALVPDPRAAERVEVARVAGLPEVNRRNRADGRPEGVSGHDEGVVGVRLERRPDVLVDVAGNIFPCVVEAAVHLAVGNGQSSVGALKKFESAFRELHRGNVERRIALGGAAENVPMKNPERSSFSRHSLVYGKEAKGFMEDSTY